jgi:outer membrane protein assembly factor BamD (BamD/ComL family)
MSSQPATQPSHPVSSFDPEIFWALHKQKILIGAIVLTAALLGGGAYFGFQAIQTQKAEAAYAAADSVERWQAVIRRFPNAIAAGNSYLRIAAKLRDEAKYRESDSAYDSFIHRYPKHPLLVDGYMGLAANAELEKLPAKALEYYKDVTTQFGNSYQAPMALFHQARLTEAKGQFKEAQQLFESVVQRYPDSIAAGIAGREAGRLADKLSQQIPKPKAEKTASPSPTASAAKLPEP